VSFPSDHRTTVDGFTTANSRICITCEQTKDAADFSLEHIFPDALGGSICSDFFKTRHVCRGCNATMGIFVDAPFIRSWFTKNGSAMAGLEFVNLDSDSSWTPLTYMGPCENIPTSNNEICEIWLCPFGEHIYHFREKDDARYDGYAGGNPIARRSNSGRAYLYLTSTDPKKISLGLRSFAKFFKNTQRYAGNFGFEKSSSNQHFIHQLNPIHVSEHTKLTEYVKANTEWSLRLQIPLGFEQRFIAKFARCLGFNLFGYSYLETNRAKELKEALWEQDFDKRSKSLKATSFFGEELLKLTPVVAIKGVYSILLMASGDVFSVILSLPTGQSIRTYISDQKNLWGGIEFEKYRDGIIYFIAPQANFFYGPVSLPAYLRHKLNGPCDERLILLEALRKSVRK